MVGRGGTQLRGKLRAAGRRQFVGVQPRRHAECGRGLEDAPRLVGAEDAVLAEHIAEAGATVGRDARQLLIEDRADVCLGAFRSGAELDGDRVGAEVRRDDLDRALEPESIRELHEAQLGLQVEAVARLGFDGRDAVPEHLVEPAPAVGGEHLIARSSRRRDGRQDPAPGLEDLEVASTLLAEEQLALARAAEQEMRVGVDEPRRDRPAGRVEPGESAQVESLGLERRLDRGPGSDGGDPALPDGDDRVVGAP